MDPEGKEGFLGHVWRLEMIGYQKFAGPNSEEGF